MGLGNGLVVECLQSIHEAMGLIYSSAKKGVYIRPGALAPVIPATWEAEVGRLVVQSQPR
jgi:hypothetical protein